MISVIIPYFNREKTIVKSLKSVINQNIEEKLEIIIVDDFSNEKSFDFLVKIANFASNVRIYRLKKNCGANYARNFGVKKARGEYIAFQDSDDVWYKNKLKEELKYLRLTKCDIIGCSMKKFNFGRKVKLITMKDLLPTNFISTQTLLCRKSIFSKINFDENMPRFQDWDFLLRASKLFKICFLRKKLVFQNIQNDSITNDIIKGYTAIKMLKEKNSVLYTKSSSFRSAYYFYLAILSVQEKNFLKANKFYLLALYQKKSRILIFSYFKFLVKHIFDL